MATIKVTGRDEEFARMPGEVREAPRFARTVEEADRMSAKVVKKAKGKTKPTSTRHRPTPRKDLTKLQRQGERVIRDTEHGPPKRKDSGGSRKKKSLASRAKNKIRRKHWILRPVAYLGVGLLVGVGKCAKWTAIGTGKASKWSGRKVVAKARRDLHTRKWVPEAPRPAGTRWFQRVESLECCGKHFHSVEGLNHHAVTAHRGEARQWAAPRPKIQRGHRRATEGKVIVRPAVAGGGRHRARHNIPDQRRADQLVAAYRAQLTKIGDKVMATEGNAKALVRAAKDFADTPKPRTLADLRDQCVGMERAGAELADAIDQYAAMLRRGAEDASDRRGANLDPALVTPYMTRAAEYATQMGKEFTRFIAAFEDYYGLEILAARKKTTPAVDLSKTG